MCIYICVINTANFQFVQKVNILTMGNRIAVHDKSIEPNAFFGKCISCLWISAGNKPSRRYVAQVLNMCFGKHFNGARLCRLGRYVVPMGSALNAKRVQQIFVSFFLNTQTVASHLEAVLYNRGVSQHSDLLWF